MNATDADGGFGFGNEEFESMTESEGGHLKQKGAAAYADIAPFPASFPSYVGMTFITCDDDHNGHGDMISKSVYYDFEVSAHPPYRHRM